MQSNNRLFDDLAALMTNAAGAAQGMREELGQMFRQQGERMAVDLDLANKEELEVVKELARKALARVEELEARVSELESQAASTGGEQSKASPPKSKPRAKKTAKKTTT